MTVELRLQLEIWANVVLAASRPLPSDGAAADAAADDSRRSQRRSRAGPGGGCHGERAQRPNGTERRVVLPATLGRAAVSVTKEGFSSERKARY